MATNISIKGKDTYGNANTTTINYVNPNATSEQLVSLATAMNNLTTNQISDITRIDKSSLTSPSTKLNRNLQLSQSTFSYANLPTDPADEGAITRITFDGTANISDFQVSHNLVGAGAIWWTWYATQEANPIYKFEIIKGVIDEYIQTGTITISLPANSIYEAASVTITITA